MIDKPTSTDEKTTLMSKVMTIVTFVVDKIKALPPIDHLIRAADRFNDRLGSQFGAAITYFSFFISYPYFNGVVCSSRFYIGLKCFIVK